MCVFRCAWIGTKHLSQMDVASSLHYIVFNHTHVFFKFNWLLKQCFHNIELSTFMYHEALPLDTISHAGRWAHTHTTSGAEQWSCSGHCIKTVGMGGESSSPVITSSLHCTQIARSSQAWEMDREYTVVNGYCYPVLNPPLNWVRQG